MNLIYLFTCSVICWNLYSSFSVGQYVQAIHTTYTLILILIISSYSQRDFPNYLPSSQSSSTDKSCIICKRAKPPRYYHCRRCNFCIFQMDHHCQWLNCCVGQYNSKLYVQVLANIVVVCIWNCVWVLLDGSFSVWRVLMLMFDVFGLYEAGRMLRGFVDFVRDNQTLVETYKGVAGIKKTSKNKLIEIFGSKPSFGWLLPTFPSTAHTDIYQPVQETGDRHSEEYTYADEYLYGPDDLDDNSGQQPQKKTE